MKKNNIWKLIRVLMFAFIITACLICIVSMLSGCRSAEKLIGKAMIKDSDKVADFTRKQFPCIVTKSDTLVLLKDTTILIDCPDEPNRVPSVDYVTPNDTIVFDKFKVVKVPITLPVRYITITKSVEDSAKIKLLQSEINKQVKKLDAANIVIEKQEKKIKNKGKFILTLLGLLLLSLTLNYLQFKRGLKLVKEW